MTFIDSLNIAKTQLINDPNLYEGTLNDRKIGLRVLGTRKTGLSNIVENADDFINYLEYESLRSLKSAEALMTSQVNNIMTRSTGLVNEPLTIILGF